MQLKKKLMFPYTSSFALSIHGTAHLEPLLSAGFDLFDIFSFLSAGLGAEAPPVLSTGNVRILGSFAQKR